MLTPASTEREGDLGDGPRPVLDPDPELPQLTPGQLGFEQARRSSPCRRASRRRPTRSPGADQRSGLSEPLRSSRRLASATASRLLAKMSPQIAGLAPATRVVSRKLGADLRSRSDSSPRGGRRLAHERVGDHVGQWLTVAIKRSWVSASIAWGRAPRSAIARCRRS